MVGCKKNLPLLAEKRYYTHLKYGYARGYEAYQYVENIRRYMNSIMNYYRVQQNLQEENVTPAEAPTVSQEPVSNENELKNNNNNEKD